MRIESLVIVRKEDKILLGLKKKREKKTGFGVGKWNGYGGGMKDEDNGNIEACARRETFDESGIRLGPLRKVGVTKYSFEEEDEGDHEVHIYVANSFEGELSDTDEMYMHTWFHVDDIPFDANENSNGCGMWHNDRFWMPYLIREEEFDAEIHMNKRRTLSCIINGKEHIQ